MLNSIYALILAGGSGERFWPLSRRARPKQLLRLISDKTLLEETLGRLEGFIPRERILILTNTEQERAVRKLLGNFPKENIVAEPAKRDTAAAVALGTGWVAARDHAAIMLVLRRDKRTCNHRHQTNVGMSRIRLHRARQAGLFAHAA
jgi:mannose-1-phosphate guanylyltransferase